MYQKKLVRLACTCIVFFHFQVDKIIAFLLVFLKHRGKNKENFPALHSFAFFIESSDSASTFNVLDGAKITYTLSQLLTIKTTDGLHFPFPDMEMKIAPVVPYFLNFTSR